MPSLPLHLIAGPPGAGKTTLVRHLIAASPQFTAVLVNDFGETGYDAALIGEAGKPGKLQVENVPGGCLCCTSAAQLRPALELLCQQPEVDRIIVEPSGIALPDPLLKMLRETAPECGFHLAPVIMVFDAARLKSTALQTLPYWRHLADRAEIAVLNRCDLAPPENAASLCRTLEVWTPPKLHIIQTSFGRVPSELLALRNATAPLVPIDAVAHTTLPTRGSFCLTAQFDRAALLRLLEKKAPDTERFKGIFQIESGAIRLEIAGGQVTEAPAPPGPISSADWIGGSDLSTALADCILN